MVESIPLGFDLHYVQKIQFLFVISGKISVEGKIYHKFDMKPHGKTIEDYGKLCRERTNKYMTKTRQIRVKVLVFL